MLWMLVKYDFRTKINLFFNPSHTYIYQYKNILGYPYVFILYFYKLRYNGYLKINLFWNHIGINVMCQKINLF